MIHDERKMNGLRGYVKLDQKEVVVISMYLGRHESNAMYGNV